MGKDEEGKNFLKMVEPLNGLNPIICMKAI